MGPVVSQLEASYTGRLEVRRYEMDTLKPGSPAHEAAFNLARQIGFDRTPTYLVADAAGRPRAMVSGATSYLTLRGAVEEALAAAGSPGP